MLEANLYAITMMHLSVEHKNMNVCNINKIKVYIVFFFGTYFLRRKYGNSLNLKIFFLIYCLHCSNPSAKKSLFIAVNAANVALSEPD